MAPPKGNVRARPVRLASATRGRHSRTRIPERADLYVGRLVSQARTDLSVSAAQLARRRSCPRAAAQQYTCWPIPLGYRRHRSASAIISRIVCDHSGSRDGRPDRDGKAHLQTLAWQLTPLEPVATRSKLRCTDRISPKLSVAAVPCSRNRSTARDVRHTERSETEDSPDIIGEREGRPPHRGRIAGSPPGTTSHNCEQGRADGAVGLLDHFVGAGEQHRRDLDAERPRVRDLLHGPGGSP
jgi:hypothetical protein